LTALALIAAAAAAQEPAPVNELEQARGRQTRAPAIPEELRPMVREATRERLLVRRVRGPDVVVDISDREAESPAQFGNGRFVGFPYAGYEFFGFTLVDRAAQGEAALIDTGERPVFSSDGRYFASAVITEGGYGINEGVAVWEVLPDRVARRFYTEAMPAGIEWRVDGWPRDACVAISAVEPGWQPPPGIDYSVGIRSAPRAHFQLVMDQDGVALSAAPAASVCGVGSSE
jgi:hypothetical protein